MLRERATALRYTYIAYLVFFFRILKICLRHLSRIAVRREIFDKLSLTFVQSIPISYFLARFSFKCLNYKIYKCRSCKSRVWQEQNVQIRALTSFYFEYNNVPPFTVLFYKCVQCVTHYTGSYYFSEYSLCVTQHRTTFRSLMPGPFTDGHNF
jgi:hypothetical protein